MRRTGVSIVDADALPLGDVLINILRKTRHKVLLFHDIGLYCLPMRFCYRSYNVENNRR